jgi:ferric-dicitrate binding protein FerR (iron transport regulator)
VEVVPDRGVRLSVETPEAEVRVVGTGFTVERDALGTRVEVRHGRVEVDCGAEVTRLLREGDTVTCLPRTAGGLLGRALALQAQNAPGEEILSVLERALALPDVSTSHADELGAHRVRVLLSLHRDAEALEAARRYLGGAPGLRRQAVERYAATAAVRLGGCATVVPWLDSPSVQDICAP